MLYRFFISLVLLTVWHGGLSVHGAADSRTTTGFLETVVVRQQETEQTITGQVLVEAQDGGLLLEERSGHIHNLQADRIISRSAGTEPYTRLTAEELSELLKQQTGPEFRTIATEHYVICHNGNSFYAEYCGRLLELVRKQFNEFVGSCDDLPVRAPDSTLPILIFSTVPEFRSAAESRHPENHFEDTTGFYSVRSNQVLLTDPCHGMRIESDAAVRRRLLENPRQVSTLVHEAVHQLAFNSGLQVRFADNPLWLSEGLALWFEPVSTSSPLLWNRPGRPNSVHRDTFLKKHRQPETALTLVSLLSTDEPFLNSQQAAAAYENSWALTSYLLRRERKQYDQLLRLVSKHRPLIPMSADDRLAEFHLAFQKTPDEIQPLLGPYIARLRVPR